MKVFFDSRWTGDHGIGRVSQALDSHLHLPHLSVSGNPASPFDTVRLLLAMNRLPLSTAVFSPGYNAPLFIARSYVFTIHDLNHLDRPENSSVMKRLYYRYILRRACRNAFRVLTVSEFSRRRIIEWADVPESHVVNIGNGVDESFNITVKAYEPGYRYFLCVGNRKGHKNEDRLLEAFAAAHINPEIRLVFTGTASESLLLKAQKLGVSSRVVFCGRVPEEDLPSLYKGAIALLFPSLYEGFGLPVVEAMACGTPVLTSTTSSLPEVAGDAALLVDPTSVEAISGGIERIVNDTNLRMELRALGLARAKEFNWDLVANRVQNVLDALILEISK